MNPRTETLSLRSRMCQSAARRCRGNGIRCDSQHKVHCMECLESSADRSTRIGRAPSPSLLMTVVDREKLLGHRTIELVFEAIVPQERVASIPPVVQGDLVAEIAQSSKADLALGAGPNHEYRTRDKPWPSGRRAGD